MNVGIIAERLNRKRTGVGVYTYHLISELLKDRDARIFLVNSRTTPSFETVPTIRIDLPLSRFCPACWHLFSQIVLSFRNYGLDVIHSPENASFFLRSRRSKKVVTVHDIIAWLYPEFGFTHLRYRLLLPRTLKTSDRIIADSYNTKEDLVRHFGVPEEKVTVIHLGVDDAFRPQSPGKKEEVLERYGLTSPYVLYVGSLARNKNIGTLVRAFLLLKDEVPHRLVMAGGGKRVPGPVRDVIGNQQAAGNIVLLDYVDWQDLPALYSAADLFVFPSVYEGFGFPPLEAMACGCPVVASNTSSLPEIIGDAGIMLDPHDARAFKEAMYSVLTDTGLREALVAKGLERSKQFSWERCAEQTMKLYEDVYAGGGK